MKRKLRIKDRKLGREVADGQYDHQYKLIEIDPRLKSRQRLRVLLHEALHHIFWDWSEGKVRRTSNKLATIVWRDRFRRLAD